MISKRFIKSSLLYTVAGTLPTASAIILLPFYQQYLSTSAYGAFGIYLAFSMLVQIIVTFSFDTGLYVFYHDHKKDPRVLRMFLSSVMIFILLVSLVVGAILVLTGELLFEVLLKDKAFEFYPFGVMSVITGIFQSLFKVHSSLLQTSERPGLFFWSNLLSFFLIALLTVGGLHYYPQTLWGPVGGRMLAAVIAGGWACGRILWFYGFTFRYEMIRSTFSFNTPAFIYQLQQWSVNSLDRFILVFFLPLSVLGVFDFAMKIMMGLEFVINGLYNSFYPKVIGIVREQQEKRSTVEINRYYHGLVAVVMVLVSMAIIGFTVVVDLGIIKSGYEKSLEFLPWVGIIYLFRAIRYYFSFPFGALKYSKPLPYVYTVIVAVKILLVILLTPVIGIYAVIVGAVTSSILESILLWRSIRSKFYFQFNAVKIIMAPTLLAIIIALMEALVDLPKYGMYSFYAIVCAIILCVLYRHEISILVTKKGK